MLRKTLGKNLLLWKQKMKNQDNSWWNKVYNNTKGTLKPLQFQKPRKKKTKRNKNVATEEEGCNDIRENDRIKK